MANVMNFGGGGANVESKTVKSTESTQTITPGDGVDGFNPVIVQPIKLTTQYVFPNGAFQTITPSSGYDGYSTIWVPESYAVMKLTVDKSALTDSQTFAWGIGSSIKNIYALSIMLTNLVSTENDDVIAAVWDSRPDSLQNSLIYHNADSGHITFTSDKIGVSLLQGTLTVSVSGGYVFNQNNIYTVFCICGY